MNQDTIPSQLGPMTIPSSLGPEAPTARGPEPSTFSPALKWLLVAVVLAVLWYVQR